MRFLYVIGIILCCFGCHTSETSRTNIIDYIPDNTSVILKTSHFDGLKSSLYNSQLLQLLSKTNSYEDLKQKLNYASNLKPLGTVLICFSKDDFDRLQYTFITKYHPGLFSTDTLQNHKREAFQFKGHTLTKSSTKEDSFYSTVIDSVFVASSSRIIVEATYNNQGVSKEALRKMYKTIKTDKTCSIIINTENSHKKSFLIADSLGIKNFTNHLALDIDINQKSLFMHGVTKAKDSSSFINVFKNTLPQENKTQCVSPSNSDGFLSFTFDDYSIFHANLQTYNRKKEPIQTTGLFDDVNEIGVIYEDKNRAIVLHTTDVIATEEALASEKNLVDTYREIPIYSFSKASLFATTFRPLVTFNKAHLYCVLDTYFVFAENIAMLQNIITDFQNKTTLNYRSHFQNIKAHLSDASSLLQVVNPSTLEALLNKNDIGIQNISFNDYNSSAIQFVYDTHFAHVHAVVKKDEIQTPKHSVSETFHLKLDKDLLNRPQFVTNHINNEKEIIVQDINLNLYLISNKGKILWKKAMPGPILGQVEQIDIYKNGRLQLAFTTPNHLFVVDRNGDDVKPFPVRFKNEITQPLSVFDYDTTKNYRLLITQDKKVSMYQVNAKLVKGFRFDSANETIISQPKHFRIATKDYITFKTKNKLYILDRTGQTRVTPKTATTYSSQPIFLYNKTFTTTNTSGALVSIDTQGNLASKPLNLVGKHSIDMSTKTLVAQSENRLLIKNKSTELDFGDYSNCKLFYFNDTLYISVTDLQSHQVYMFDSQCRLLDHFPVYGNSLIDFSDIDQDKKLEFVTKGDTNSIILYQIN